MNRSWQTAVVYPDSADELEQDEDTRVWTITTDNGDHTATTYDRLGRVDTATDQRGVKHEYAYDTAGRLSADEATILGTSDNVDNFVRCIATDYDDLGRVQTVTSRGYDVYNEPTVVRNQVEYAYDGWGNLALEYQAHAGEVDPETTPAVQYTYADGATGNVAKYVRLEQVTYPDGIREIHYNYAAGVDEIMSRLSSISDGGNLAEYTYLGLGTIVKEAHPQVSGGLNLDYDPNGDNSYSGFDRFGRVADQLWADDSWSPVDEYKYGYDRAGNRTSRTNETKTNGSLDETYQYDDLDRLKLSERADDVDQSWTLDGLGNFAEFNDDGTIQDRTVNAANQIQDISDSADTVTPLYDAAGNMIVAPKTGDEDVPIHYVYDAWNRQVGVYADEDGELGALIAEYKYDGRNRRVEKTATADAPGGARQVEYYFNQNWQLLEERLFNAQSEPSGSHVYVWSQHYIDAPILRDTYDSEGDLNENARVYYTGDANYNVTATLDSTGAVISRNVYDAYGKTTVYDEDWLNGVPPAEDGPLYCGYWFDLETGNDLARNRYYSVTLATWFIPDPIGYKGGMNLYEYCHESPLISTDPSGKRTCECKIYGGGHGGFIPIPVSTVKMDIPDDPADTFKSRADAACSQRRGKDWWGNYVGSFVMDCRTDCEKDADRIAECKGRCDARHAMRVDLARAACAIISFWAPWEFADVYGRCVPAFTANSQTIRDGCYDTCKASNGWLP